MVRIKKSSKKRDDERGTRTPGMQGITGLAIPRHTGLGYLVISNFRNASPKMHFIYLIFSGENTSKKFTQKIIVEKLQLYYKATFLKKSR
jgi:hypothetical protein